MLEGKHIVVGISGGIAAYKIPMLIRLLVKQGAEVRTVVTKNALEFVTELTLQTVSNNKVYRDMFAQHNEHSTEHISLSDWADLLIVAPATANVIGKMANGIADDALTTTFLAAACPVLIAPAMNSNMYQHPALQHNIHTLSQWSNIHFVDPEEGELACRAVGTGRMAEPETIALKADYLLHEHDMKGMRVVITAGPTRELIDPVRFISNFSTGKMAYALAREASRRGAAVDIVSGPVDSAVLKRGTEYGAQVRRADSCQQMYEQTTALAPQADIIILCAAVADFHISNEQIAKEKISRKGDSLTLTFTPTQDIAAAVGKGKQEGQVLVGFALETTNEKEHALQKMSKKNLDIIVLNSLNDAGAGFGYDTNRVTIFTKDGQQTTLPLMLKEEVATEIINRVVEQKNR